MRWQSIPPLALWRPNMEQLKQDDSISVQVCIGVREGLNIAHIIDGSLENQLTNKYFALLRSLTRAP